MSMVSSSLTIICDGEDRPVDDVHGDADRGRGGGVADVDAGVRVVHVADDQPGERPAA